MNLRHVFLLPLVGLIPSCVHISSDPIEVKPIHIIADINVRIDRQIDDFFAFQDKYRAPATAPASQPAVSAAQGA